MWFDAKVPRKGGRKGPQNQPPTQVIFSSVCGVIIDHGKLGRFRMASAKKECAIRVKGRLPGTTFEVSSMDELRQLILDNEVDATALSLAGNIVPVYTPGWEFDFPKPGHRFPMAGLELTEPFYLTYEAVTKAIREYY